MEDLTAHSPQDLNGWRNWDGRQHCFPHVIERPQNVLELRGALDRAQQAGRKVRVAGSGHSFTALVPTDGSLISMERMNRVLEVDPISGVVRVEAGITIGELNRQLDRHGLAFENLGDIDKQSLAGATATGTHGTGSRLRNLSSQLQGRRAACRPTAASWRSTRTTIPTPGARPASASARSAWSRR